MKRLGFDNAFVFRYSKRKDIPAAEMDSRLLNIRAGESTGFTLYGSVV